MGYKMTTYKKKQEMMAIFHLGGRRLPCPLPLKLFCRGYKATIAGEIVLKNVTTGLRKRREKVRFIEIFAVFLRELSRNRADLIETSSIPTFKCVFLAFFCVRETSNTGCLGHRCGGSGEEGRMVVTPRKAPSIGLPSYLP